MTNGTEEPGPLVDDIKAAMGELTGTQTLPTLSDGEPITKRPLPRQLEPETAVLTLGLDEDAAWRARFIRLDESHHPKVAKLARWAEWFIRRGSHNLREKGHGLVVVGPPGTGKSHAAKRILRWFQAYSVDLWFSRKWTHPPKSVFVDWAALCEKDKEEAFDEALYQIAEADVVILDDVGSESDKFKSGAGVSRLRRVLSLCEHKWLYVNANIPNERWDTSLDARVSDRLTALHYLDMSGAPSYRPKLRG
jgi:DNA replication protein DnaC